MRALQKHHIEAYYFYVQRSCTVKILELPPKKNRKFLKSANSCRKPKFFGNSKKIYARYGVVAVGVAVAVVVSDSKFVRTITRVNMNRF